MAVRTTAELMEMVRNRIGEDHSDEALAMLEDMTDSLADYDRRILESGDWERKYNENDEAWRKRYRERFENAPSVQEPEDIVAFVPNATTTVVDNTDPEVEPETFDDLFTTEV